MERPAPGLHPIDLPPAQLGALVSSHALGSTYCSILHAAQRLETEVSPALAELGTTPSGYRLLGKVVEAQGSTPAELARRCGLSPQYAVEVLDRAEAEGLVRREGVRGRGRRTRVHLTQRGYELLAEGWNALHQVGADLLTPREHRQLRELLQRLGRPAPATSSSADPDVVVLVAEDGSDAGLADRTTVHTQDTPLHRAFSTYLRDHRGRVLMTRRSLHKATWPGVWTNSACGHLRPGEDAIDAAMRRVPEELGASPGALRVALPDFRYRAVDASGIVENELCPVLLGDLDPDLLAPDPTEVAEHAWVEWQDLRTTAARMPRLLSPWCVEQVQLLGDQPWGAR